MKQLAFFSRFILFERWSQRLREGETHREINLPIVRLELKPRPPQWGRRDAGILPPVLLLDTLPRDQGESGGI